MSDTVQALNQFDNGVSTLIDTDLDRSLMECIDLTTQDIWMTVEPVDQTHFDQLTDLPENHVPTGIASPSYDYCLFRQPGAYDGEPTEIREFAGHRWVNVARIADFGKAQEEGGPLRVKVHKDHVMAFDAGRELVIMTLDGKHYVECVGTGKDDDDLVLPEGATLTKMTLNHPFIAALPVPASTFFWLANEQHEMRSFQGPVQLP